MSRSVGTELIVLSLLKNIQIVVALHDAPRTRDSPPAGREQTFLRHVAAIVVTLPRATSRRPVVAFDGTSVAYFVGRPKLNQSVYRRVARTHARGRRERWRARVVARARVLVHIDIERARR